MNTAEMKLKPVTARAVFDGGSGGFDPPQEVADPPESSAEALWESTLTP